MDAELKQKLLQISTCDISDALVKLRLDGDGTQTGGLIPDLKMYSPLYEAGTTRIVGPVFTVRMTLASDGTSPRPSTHFVDACPGEHIMMMQVPRGVKAATWGGLMSIGAKTRGVQGVVIDGGCRDLAEHREIGFPVFARHHSTLGQGTFVRPAELNVPLSIPAEQSLGGVAWPDTKVNPGDIIVCDVDGCVVIPADKVREVAEMAQRGKEIDERIGKAIAEGMGVAEAMKKFRT
ncbi:ribonuclease E inhibitor RraA/Dimethylmenaquinone methyltransferase [Dioszegia hungarica]|uniref:Ribonuclease E inhibitor RraA/Dimethylmenaquinone methyltransferase n=1 Tax=Dioszegia hungarica TaxID=4972 RepID=A0AA38LXH5_9TREE|nr:ribonuclease E inhibitor RraA/Dimethylmenaquinone methyltransferase [Dioszegia hungarica]KAI9639645.1 ribonuclease E inhibitor RraA/Dimethylmenaquinone methyltransferase [Dioszegia hungarica]